MRVAVKMYSGFEKYMLSIEKRCHIVSLWIHLDRLNDHAFLKWKYYLMSSWEECEGHKYWHMWKSKPCMLEESRLGKYSGFN